MIRQCIAFFLICLTATAVGIQAQARTIPAQVEQVRPRPLVKPLVEELAVPFSFESAVRDADLILEGSVTKLKSYLSENEEVLYTDYEVTPLSVISARAMPGSKNPGPQPIVVQTWGGETTINGVEVKIYNVNLRPLPIGRPLLLLLTFNKEIGKYEIYAQGAFAFEIDDRRTVKSRLPPGIMEPKLSSAGLDDAIRDIHRLGR